MSWCFSCQHGHIPIMKRVDDKEVWFCPCCNAPLGPELPVEKIEKDLEIVVERIVTPIETTYRAEIKEVEKLVTPEVIAEIAEEPVVVEPGVDEAITKLKSLRPKKKKRSKKTV